MKVHIIHTLIKPMGDGSGEACERSTASKIVHVGTRKRPSTVRTFGSSSFGVLVEGV